MRLLPSFVLNLFAKKPIVQKLPTYEEVLAKSHLVGVSNKPYRFNLTDANLRTLIADINLQSMFAIAARMEGCTTKIDGQEIKIEGKPFVTDVDLHILPNKWLMGNTGTGYMKAELKETADLYVKIERLTASAAAARSLQTIEGEQQARELDLEVATFQIKLDPEKVGHGTNARWRMLQMRAMMKFKYLVTVDQFAWVDRVLLQNPVLLTQQCTVDTTSQQFFQLYGRSPMRGSVGVRKLVKHEGNAWVVFQVEEPASRIPEVPRKEDEYGRTYIEVQHRSVTGTGYNPPLTLWVTDSIGQFNADELEAAK